MPIVFFSIVLGILSFSFSIHAQENKSVEPLSMEEQIFEQLGPLTLLDLAPLTKEEIIERLKKDLNIHIKTPRAALFDRYFLSYIYNYFQTMKPDSLRINPYNLYSLDHDSSKLVSLSPGSNLYFSKNASVNTITKRFKEIMDAIFNQEVFPDEIQMTFQYSNELYAQLNEVVLSSEDIKAFINKHSGIQFGEEFNNAHTFTRDELLMILKQYLDLPVHIRDNLALKRIVRVDNFFSMNIFFPAIGGKYDSGTETITLADSAFEQKNTDDKGENAFLHEIGHALWGKSVWIGLSEEAKKDYERLSWQRGKKVNDEFISDYSAESIHEDFSEHFAAYINNGENLKQEVEAKYQWLKKHIFLNTEYLMDVADNLKIFVESEDGDTHPPYFMDPVYESIKIGISVDVSSEDYWRDGSADVKVEVSGLFDDMSKIKKIDILMQSEEDHFWLNSPEDFKFCSEYAIDEKDKSSLDCVFINPQNPGEYIYYDSKKLILNYPGDYQITQLKLEDEVGNKKTLRSQLGDAMVPFPGAKDKWEEEVREQKEREAEMMRRARRGRKAAEDDRQRKEMNQEIKGFNILNLLEHPVVLYSGGVESKDGGTHPPSYSDSMQGTMTLEYGECISLIESELPSLRLKTNTAWFDGELDAIICSNTEDSSDIPRCWVGSNSLVKINWDEEYIVTEYQGEKSADFRKCRPSIIKKKRDNKETRLRKTIEGVKGLNIFNSSEENIKIYQDQEEVGELEPKQCMSLTPQELLVLTLKQDGGWFGSDPFICTNIENSLNIHKCDVAAASVLKQNTDEEYILTKYQGEKSADFRRCWPLTTDIKESLPKKDRDPSPPPAKEEEPSDNTPPYLTHPAGESVFVSVEDYNRDTMLIKVEVIGLFDDMSKINHIAILMESEEEDDDYFWLQPPRDDLCKLTSRNVYFYSNQCLFFDHNKPGRYVFYVSKRRDEFFPANYRAKQINFANRARYRDNRRDFDKDLENSLVYLPGKRLIVNEDTMKEDLEIRTSKTSANDTLVHIFTTDMTIFDQDIFIEILDEESRKLRYSIDITQLSSLNEHFNSPHVFGKMSLPIVIPKDLISGRYRLNWIAFNKDQSGRKYYMVFDESNRDTYFNHISLIEEDFTIAQPVVDDIDMEVLKGENLKGGDTSIKIDIPVEGLDRGDGNIEVVVRTPTGDRLSFSSELESHPREGSQNISAVMHLGPRHPEGEYMITHISTTEDYSSSVNERINHEGLSMHKGAIRKHEARLLERNIRTTLTVSTPHPPSEKH